QTGNGQMSKDLEAPVRLRRRVPPLGPGQKGELPASDGVLKRTLPADGLDPHHSPSNVAIDIENVRSSTADVQKADGSGSRNEPALRRHEIAAFCLARADLLKQHELEFVEQMESWTALGLKPSEAQARWLYNLYFRLKSNNRGRRRHA